MKVYIFLLLWLFVLPSHNYNSCCILKLRKGGDGRKGNLTNTVIWWVPQGMSSSGVFMWCSCMVSSHSYLVYLYVVLMWCANVDTLQCHHSVSSLGYFMCCLYVVPSSGILMWLQSMVSSSSYLEWYPHVILLDVHVGLLMFSCFMSMHFVFTCYSWGVFVLSSCGVHMWCLHMTSHRHPLWHS